MNNSFRASQSAQDKWATAIVRDPARPLYAASVADNLFLKRLTPHTEAEFREADGSELRDTPRRPAKMRALLSSSALAVNFFDAWRGRPASSLGHALGLGVHLEEFRFEYVCKAYPVPPRAPNLDLLLSLSSGHRVAVEAKFTEPYRSPGHHGQLAPKYFASTQGLWNAAGLVKAQVLATGSHSDWKYVNASQLLKHMLGLANDGCTRVLLYLWYDTELADARKHREEIQQFGEMLRDDAIEFRATTYQAAFEHLRTVVGLPMGWSEYMRARYFNGAVSNRGHS